MCVLEMEASIKPSVCFEIEKIIGVSVSEGNIRSYQVQWAPTWVTSLNLVGCERLIEEFNQQQWEHTRSNEFVVSAGSTVKLPSSSCEPKSKHPAEVGPSLIDGKQKEFLSPGQTETNEDVRNIQLAQSPTIHFSNMIESDFVHSVSKLVEGSLIRNDFTPDSDNPSFIDPHIRRHKGRQKYLSNIWSDSSNQTQKLPPLKGDNAEHPCSEPELSKPSDADKASAASLSMRTWEEDKTTNASKHEDDPMEGTLVVKTEDSISTNSTFMNDTILMDESRNKHHSCTTCGKSFAKRDSLRVHERIHSGDKPYKCEECDQAFAQRGNLTKHMRLHTGEKPFVCSECGRSFTASNNMRRHMKKLHPNAAWWVE